MVSLIEGAEGTTSAIDANITAMVANTRRFDDYAAFKKLGVEIYGVSTHRRIDSVSHIGPPRHPRDDNG